VINRVKLSAKPGSCMFLVFFFCLVFLSSNTFAADKLAEGMYQAFNQKRTGDYEELVKERVIRVLVPYSKTFYFLDGATQRGATYEMVVQFEKFINAQLKTKHLKVHLVIIPTSRDRLIPALAEGLGDIAAGNLTITEGRLEQVDFTDPAVGNVDEIVVTGPSAPKIKTLEDLSGKEIHTRKSSSYYESLVRLNKKFAAAGKPEMKIVFVSEYLEDEDLLEMLSADLIPMVVIDSHKGVFWKQVLDKITLHPDIKVNSGGKIAWAIRKNSPELKGVINKFTKKNKKGTLFGNIIIKRYLKNTTFVKNNLQKKEYKRFQASLVIFKKYGEQYGFDQLMLAALAYQESTIDQSKRSHAGAVGVMQILPSTAKDKNVGVPDIGKIDSNIHAGTKYLSFMVNRYFNEPGMDELNRGLFAFASYNAGPARVAKLRKEAEKAGLDPNVWFRNVEIIAAKRIGRETVQYVSNIFKYYTAYLYISNQHKIKAQEVYGD